MEATSIGSQIVSTVVETAKGLASGLSSTVVETFNAVFVNAEGGLSNLAIWGLVMGAVGLGYGLIRMFTRKAG